MSAQAAKHTPGPWRAKDAHDGYEIVSSSPGMSATVAVLTARRSVTGAADARLIAAAPAMREALEMIAGTRPCLDNLMSDKDIALAALHSGGGRNNDPRPRHHPYRPNRSPQED